jgi:flavin reductase (DIM6/NTAB) family NADH-FMN oxidoreductase RutF
MSALRQIAPATVRVDPLGIAAPSPASFSEPDFRRALGRFATGVTLVSAARDGGPLGLVVNAFTSVSLEPPLIAICPSLNSFTWSRMRGASRFGVNVLGAAHADYVSRVAAPDANRFAGIDYGFTESGVPRISSAVAFLECEAVSEHVAGDHWIVVARVHELNVDVRQNPLVFSDGTLGGFHRLQEELS